MMMMAIRLSSNNNKCKDKNQLNKKIKTKCNQMKLDLMKKKIGKCLNIILNIKVSKTIKKFIRKASRVKCLYKFNNSNNSNISNKISHSKKVI